MQISLQDLAAAFIIEANARQYGIIIVALPSDRATLPSVKKELKQGSVKIFGNAPDAETQIRILRETADKIESVQSEVNAGLKH